jgi:hypothetical protein
MEMMNLVFRASWTTLQSDFLHGIKRLHFPFEGRRAVDFYHAKKSIASAGFERANLASNGKHTNHYTTKATS